MSEIEIWFNELNTKVHSFGEFEFVISKGFKITHYLDNGEYTIQDTRKRDFYTKVSEEDLDVIKSNGFIKGTSIIMHQINESRVEKYLDLIQKLYVKRREDKKIIRLGIYKNPNQQKDFYLKRIQNCNQSIHTYTDLLHFYKSKVEQFNNKLTD